jgi:signal transduction histidine kinase/ActR/RegA family two-component response regulator
MSKRLASQLALVAGLTLIYVAAGRLGLRLAFVNASATAVWPPTGIALAAFVVLGYRIWPAILLGAFLVNVTTSGDVATSVAIAVGNTLEGLVGAYLVNRLAHGRHVFERARDIFVYVLLACIISTTISATVGVTSLTLSGLAAWADYGPIWLTWWLGDAVGAILVAPVLVLWTMNPRVRWNRRHGVEAILLCLSALLVATMVFGGLSHLGTQHYPLEFLILPIIVWAAFRFDQRAAATLALGLSGIAIWGTLTGFGPFARESPAEALLLLQAFMGIIAITGLGLAAVVAERQQVEAALRRSRDDFEVQVEQRTAELRAANAELAQAARLKDEFMANMSHELRTPLTSILGLAELLREEIYGGLNRKQDEALQRITESGQHLLEMINGILDLGKIEAGQMELYFEPVEIVAIAQTSVHLLSQSAKQKGVRVVTSFDHTVQLLHADARSLKQILVNLLANAVKFTPAGGQVGLDIVGDTAQGIVSCSVWDTGIGIAEEDLARIFEPFVQLDGRLARAYGGTGLGLALVARMVDLNGGSIAVTSRMGHGSRFTVALPWNQAAAAPASQKDTPAPAGVAVSAPASLIRQPLVLVAEDNPINLIAVTDCLIAKGYRVVVAHDGAEAVIQAHAARPNMIVMDIQMPKMDGLEAIRRIRADATLMAVPIIALTALVMPGDRERCLAAGAHVYLSKPVRLGELVTTIQAHYAAGTPHLDP